MFITLFNGFFFFLSWPIRVNLYFRGRGVEGLEAAIQGERKEHLIDVSKNIGSICIDFI